MATGRSLAGERPCSRGSVLRLALVSLMVIAAAVHLTVVSADDNVIGCGGFVQANPDLFGAREQSDVHVDYSSITVELHTLDSLVKSSTECFPNGYYFIPVEDKGTYVLKARGPEGWYFQPEQVEVMVDQNGCGGNEDINFHYTGFSLSGRVLGAVGGQSCQSPRLGPKGVNVTLASSTTGEGFTSTITEEGGIFSFGNLPTGRYWVSASHPKWSIMGSPVEVTLGWGNGKVPEELIVDGYDLQGSVVSQGTPVLGVQIYLFSDDIQSINCPQGLGSPPQTTYGHALCHVSSDADGHFAFPSVPCGEYVLVPVYKGEHTVFDVSPASQKVLVTQGSKTVDPSFQVTGFSIGGWVKDGAGKGIEGVAIFVDGSQRAVTDPTGKYKIDQVKTAQYSFEARKANYKFSSLKKFKVLPNIELLPDIKPTHYSLCGAVRIFDPSVAGERGIKLVSMVEGGSEQHLRADKNGRYCFEVAPGKYRVSPVVLPEERESGLLFTPSFLETSVLHEPVLDVDFAQARISVSGKVRCIRKPCGSEVIVSLTAASKKVVAEPVEHSQQLGPDDSFLFSDVSPGTYIVSAKQPAWCWVRGRQEVSGVENIEGVELVQKGYAMTVTSAHAVSAIFSSRHSRVADVIKPGTQKWCLEDPEVHEISFDRPCLFFGQDSFLFDPANPEMIRLKASKYLLTGQLLVSALKVADANQIAHELTVDVRRSDGGESLETLEVVRVIEANESSPVAVFEFRKWAEMGESFVFTPDHSSLLFYPSSRQAVVTEDACQPLIAPFDVRPGLTIKGSVSPAIEHVAITVKLKETSAAAGMEAGHVAAVLETDSSGFYSSGPLFDDTSYEVSAEKEGYHFRPLGELSFEGRKLGQVVVSVHLAAGAEEEEDEPMSGVLLSLSGGGGYRKNAATGPGGVFSFTGLFPGNYFVRPMMKEYSFNPPAGAIEMKGGESKPVVVFAARRVAYSVFGTVRALGGNPEEGIVVEARAQSGSQYEEARSDAQGQYRLRGLLPWAAYTIQVKRSGDSALRIERTSPSTFSITVGMNDTKDVDFVVFEQSRTCTLTGTTIPSKSKWQPHIMVQVASVHSPEKVEREVPLPLSHFFEIAGLERGRYIVQLVFSLRSRTHIFKSEPVEVDLESNCQTHIGALHFQAQERHEKQELAPAPVIPVAVGLLIVILAANMSRLQSTYSRFMGSTTPASGSSGASSSSFGHLASTMSGGLAAMDALLLAKKREIKKPIKRRMA